MKCVKSIILVPKRIFSVNNVNICVKQYSAGNFSFMYKRYLLSILKILRPTSKYSGQIQKFQGQNPINGIKEII